MLTGLYCTIKNGVKCEIKTDSNFNYHLFIDNIFIKKYKNKKALFNRVLYDYDISLMF